MAGPLARRVLGLAPIAAAALASCASQEPYPAPEGWDREPARIVRSLRDEGQLLAGAARVSLDPPYAVPMGGYFGANLFALRYQRDALSARAVVLQAGKLRVGIVALDLVLVPPELRPLVEGTDGFRVAKVDAWTVSASHDHTSLGGIARQWPAQVFGIGAYDPLIIRFVARQAGRALAEAGRTLRPVELAEGAAGPGPHDPRLSFNRKVPGGFDDQTVRAIGLWPAGGVAAGAAPLVRLVNFAGHPTMIPAHLRGASADYPGVLCRDLEADGSTALFLNGASGDLAGGMYEDERSWWRRRMPLEGHRIAAYVRDALRGAAPAPATSGASTILAYTEGEVLLPPRQPWRVPAIGRAIAGFYPDRVRARCIRIGDRALFFFPGEMGSDLGRAIVKEMEEPPPAPAGGGGPRLAWLVTLSDDYLGYVFSGEEYLWGGNSQHLTIYGIELGALLRARLPPIARAAWGPAETPPSSRVP
jgi:neutral ceramidase